MKKTQLDELRDSPLYTQSEAGLYLGIPRSTLRYWAIGEMRNSRKVKPLIEIPYNSKNLSFLNLIELHILNSLRRDHNIDLVNIRKALNFVKRKMQIDRPLLAQHFETDGVDLFVEHYGKLINVSKEGQQAMRAVLQSSLRRVERDSRKIPIKLYPYTHSNFDHSPKVVSMTPYLFSGRPVIDGTGISTAVIADRYKAGDSVTMLADDYNLDHKKIEEAIRCELPIAA